VILVQLILVLSFAAVFFFALRSRTAHSVSATKKLAFMAFLLVVLVAVFSPRLVTAVANLVGVGRGTDLVLYLLAVMFCFYVVNDYLRGQDARNQVHKLARRIAVLEALERYEVLRDSVPADPEAGASQRRPDDERA
jgi:small membrane protein